MRSFKFFVIVGLLFIFVYTSYLLYFKNYTYIIKAEKIIYRLSTDKKARAIYTFSGSEKDNTVGGIYAGSFGKYIYIWTLGRKLKTYRTDEYSVYSYFDGCNEKIKDLLKKGENPNVIEKQISNDISQWKKSTKTGDYVLIYLTKDGMGGTNGNLREIYAYNFWLFLEGNIDKRCEK